MTTNPIHESGAKISPARAWLLAARPKTLPAAVGPVLLGTAAAMADGRFAFFPAFGALAVALLLQIGVNLANDYFDFRHGIDTTERLGPPRAVHSGWISPGNIRLGMGAVFAAAAAVGLYLASVGGWVVILAGGASILVALAYSGGPFPLASNGLGDLFVFIFFGPVAVCGTYYVQAHAVTAGVALAAVPVGFLITAILVVNNLRDIPTDRKTGKRTLAVILGRRATVIEYLLLVSAAYSVLPIIWTAGGFSAWVLLPFFSLPTAAALIGKIGSETGAALNTGLGGTANLSLIYSLLLSVSLVLGGV